MFTTVADEVADDEEVADEPGLFDNLEFELEPVNDPLNCLGISRRLRCLRLFGGCLSRRYVSRQPARILHALNNKLLPLRSRVNSKPPGKPLCQLVA